MGCLGGGLAALLALAIPASIARGSLVGALVVLAALAAAATAVVVLTARRRAAGADPLDAPVGRSRARTQLIRLAAGTLVYAVVVTLIHDL